MRTNIFCSLVVIQLLLSIYFSALFNVDNLYISIQENLHILRDLSMLQVHMRDLEGYRVSSFCWF